MQKSGLDRVFDSIRKDKNYSEYLQTQENWKNLADYAAGEATDAIIEWGRDYVSSTNILDPTFNFIEDILKGGGGGGGDPGRGTINPPFVIPADAATRNSNNYITPGTNHSVVIGVGGTVWDTYQVQKNLPNGINNWKSYKAAVAASNPDIKDLNRVVPGQVIMQPDRTADGFTRYHYSNGEMFSQNPNTGESSIHTTDDDGNQVTYTNYKDPSGGYTSTTTVMQGDTVVRGNIKLAGVGQRDPACNDFLYQRAA